MAFDESLFEFTSRSTFSGPPPAEEKAAKLNEIAIARTSIAVRRRMPNEGRVVEKSTLDRAAFFKLASKLAVTKTESPWFVR